MHEMPMILLRIGINFLTRYSGGLGNIACNFVRLYHSTHHCAGCLTSRLILLGGMALITLK
jgi:hypothetical protein